MKILAAAIFFGLVVLAAGYAAGQYLAGGYQQDRMIQYISEQPPVQFFVPEGGQQY